MDSAIPAPPSDLEPRGRGRHFWRAVLAENELRPDELEVLAESCRMLDLLDQLRLSATDIIVDGKMHPAIVEARQVRQELRRALAQLSLQDPEGEEERGIPRSRLHTLAASPEGGESEVVSWHVDANRM